MTGIGSNTGLVLTSPDATQSVPFGPLCLLSGLAAQPHVRRAKEHGEQKRHAVELTMIYERFGS